MSANISLGRTVLFLFAILAAHDFPVSAAPPTEPAVNNGLFTKARGGNDGLIGQPTSLMANPDALTLDGVRDARQLTVTGTYSNGTVRDLTTVVDFAVEPAGLLEVGPGLYLRGQKNGEGKLTLRASDKTTVVKFTVRNMDQSRPVSFRRDVIATLNVGGCNMGACHGTPSGKNGFKLSLRGFDPAADYQQLTRDLFGRRSDKHDPAAALVWLKGLGRVPHEGGARFGANSLPGEMLANWLKEGMADDPKNLPPLKKLEALPGSRILTTPARNQQLAILATYADSSTPRDVTRLTNFSSSDPGIADVNMNGLVEFKKPGEVAILCRYLEEMVSVRLTYLEPRANFRWPSVPENNFVDTQVFAKLKQMTIAPSDLCSDGDFVRRAYLDSVGRLPTPAESRAFMADTAENKRAALIDTLVRLPEFADFWALKWADVLRNSRKTSQLKGAIGMQLWLRDQLLKNEPFDSTVRQLLTSTGNTYQSAPANYYRVAKEPTALAESTAQLFLGVRMQCAKCHNHPFERWSQDDYYGLAAVFARVKTKPDPTAGAKPKDGDKAGTAEVVYVSREGEVSQPRTGQVMKPRFPGSGDQDLPRSSDRRQAFADWLTKPGNPFFARSVSNRVWFHLMGKGIVDPVDDFRESNPASNDALLDALAEHFAKSNFDLRSLVGTIMKSKTYQLSSRPNETNKDDSRYFSHAITRLLTAEQLLDALCDLTGVPEKYTGLPAGTRAIQLPDGEVNHPFLKAFGQPARELACECEREADGNLAQALQLINGPTVNEKIKNVNNRLSGWLGSKQSDQNILAELYMLAFSRPPEKSEIGTALDYLAKAKDRRKAWEDLLWAVLNTQEFLFRH